MNNFYDIFASYYDEIFPVSEDLISFTSSYLTNKNSYLDVGTGSGELVVKISKTNLLKEIIATDIDEKMLEIAKKKSNSIKFLKMDMKEINYKQKFDLITCYGNTIVHLTSINEIELFFNNIIDSLKSDGKFLFQILNYNIRQDFPVIQNENFIFERYYKYGKELIEFYIKFTLKKTKETFESSIFLYPLTYQDIIKILKPLKLKNISFFSDFKKNQFFPYKSNLLIGEIEK
ncbi:MAG: class I SAM-dependent methyltransferase [Brevinematales bacterium]|nr:class I SAM-dependent methyltransferase [Brevinematales bacterium]